MFDISQYDYELPEHLIAQVPAERRDHSRLLAVDRCKRSFSDHHFYDLPRLLKPGDLLVVNNTRVVPARLFGKKESGGRVEILILDHSPVDSGGSDSRLCLLKSSKRPKTGSLLLFDNDLCGVVESMDPDGLLRIRFEGVFSLEQYLETHGAVPIPPYIRRDARSDLAALDRERYQTVFAQRRGAVAAPTAGLHFTQETRTLLAGAGVDLVEITLHVGYGTFKIVRTRDIRKHRVGEEEYFIEATAAEAIRRAKSEGGRVIAVGTTVVRALETAAATMGSIGPCKGKTDLLITPGFRFKLIDGLVTNFHLPRSSLLFLVSALAGIDLMRDAYRHAVESSYRFYSYGDAMLIL
ncbi:MAG: tRNA preQ1(34) S-adenosylmethionine ribosyltransferase-isomerase QueA [Desulfobacteraceae bacterium]|nr:MAG: tRNA preQ1(34) S-adenosylmethionine ribosyltransferase-isomerase QueA [Desulfobacteraceae bacterium]